MAVEAIDEAREFSNPDDFNSQVREYVLLKKAMDTLEKRQKELKEKLFEKLDEEGVEDSNGNIQINLEAPIEGIARLEKQRRVTRKLNEPKADMILTDLGIKDDIYVMTPVLDEDELMAAFWDGKITEEQLDDMFPVTTVWALRTVK